VLVAVDAQLEEPEAKQWIGIEKIGYVEGPTLTPHGLDFKWGIRLSPNVIGKHVFQKSRIRGTHYDVNGRAVLSTELVAIDASSFQRVPSQVDTRQGQNLDLQKAYQAQQSAGLDIRKIVIIQDVDFRITDRGGIRVVTIGNKDVERAWDPATHAEDRRGMIFGDFRYRRTNGEWQRELPPKWVTPEGTGVSPYWKIRFKGKDLLRLKYQSTTILHIINNRNLPWAIDVEAQLSWSHDKAASEPAGGMNRIAIGSFLWNGEL
jgi:hypothetical protein